MQAPALYELLIRGNADGTIAGSHVIHWEPDGFDKDGKPRFMQTVPKPLHLAEIDDTLTSGLYRFGAQVSQLMADLEAARREIARLQALVRD